MSSATAAPRSKILMIVGDFAEDYEVMVPYQTLETLGFQVDIVSPDKPAGDTIATAVHDFTGFQTYTETRGHNVALTRDLPADAHVYAGLFVPGGRAPEFLRLDARVLALTRHFFETGKPVACVCHGAQILAAAGVLKGRTVTCYAACAPEVVLAGAQYKEVAPAEAVVDGNLVTSPAWPEHQALLKEFIKLLGVQVVHSKL
ncbi:class I glutamine amidotransferase-like protein [Chytriomyces sp. MP71]|nr:class I glutamine amidotransferase-like protein [Chytriomyces sp. MP71]